MRTKVRARRGFVRMNAVGTSRSADRRSDADAPVDFAPMSTVRQRFEIESHRDRFGRLLLVLVVSFLLSGWVGGVWYRIILSVLNVLAIIIAATATGFPERVPTAPAVAVLSVFAAGALILSPIDSNLAHGWGAICSFVVTVG